MTGAVAHGAVLTGGPSLLHEKRVATLVTLATLNGFTGGPDILPSGARPDVLLLRASDGAAFVGDAKATESPGTSETYERLAGYVRFLSAWLRSGRCGALVLAVDPVDAYGWLGTLRELSVDPSGGHRAPGRTDVLGTDEAVVWQGFVGSGPTCCGLQSRR